MEKNRINNDVKEKQFSRSSVSHESTYQRFVILQNASFARQYSHIYVQRLNALRDQVLERIKQKYLSGIFKMH